MSVKLISITPDAEKLIMYCARVSSPNQDSNNTKLLAYCIKNAHWSIFEQANMTVEVETSRAISAQILRHKSLNFQEFSQRYAEVQSFQTYEARRQDDKNRQNSIDDLSEEAKLFFNIAQEKVQTISTALYEECLKLGIAKESARFLLPISATTKLYMTGSVRSFIHYIQVRTDATTQKEHRDVANKIKEIFIQQFPNIAQALDWKIQGEQNETV